ncbi:MAG TPA: flavin-dependent monooxygenase [Gordonia sp. (in: high G+C Gram-positive bacteria)]|uniref:3-hydroxy-9,10-secoandrosta-1,3,5(10)-triene-9, 17-dione monooxygenase oxygenase subunit n=1 Tax=unclassified Gordonia (in: high G+C Gram-positive bacteria) TaxID=2657482 RepID=UPI000FBC2253|nr:MULTISPECIES: 3-hydroxy-9,10-secoandrosta-1,3,5(10)-triene-9,17-dione monooxygenase oxygenase subunit [unclassified Gordonia (in: high G+C Gram-positive bacteria)]RUP41741.1 MAG: flavin-dependent monooxygenase [Gordonia sp. (in: high G+C Gram-positive bacteria)]HNP56794.1 flavin-dependent monooxygenase [Gordonia sp. (in: high G+C Gram-positive bacteria)]HRC49917.1 flavin-dependent monooxygenase [Gordonia sp. (in: high G+C Gram-positive bacteria)]
MAASTTHRSAEAQKVLDNIDALLPDFAQRAQATEDARRVSDESAQQLQEAGFFKLLQPEQWNGYQCDPVSFYEAVRRIASACGSAGWVAGIIGVHNWHLALFDQQAQEEVWGKDTDVRISSSYAPMGIGEVVDGGYKVNGNWAFSSGCDLADWTFVGGPVIKDGRPVDFVSYLLPREDYTIKDVWNVVGLKGTGSNTLEVKDVFVPRHRVLSMRTMGMGESPGLERNTAPVYKMPWGTIHPSTIATPIVGMAYGAYDAHVEHQGKRVRAAYAGEKSKDDPFAKVRIAQAASEIDAAWRQLSGNLQAEYDLILAGEEVPMELRLAARRDQVRATGRAIEAIDMLFENSGAGALNVDSPIQRFWRDAHGGRVHAANDPERAYVAFGNGEFGIPIGDTMV